MRTTLRLLKFLKPFLREIFLSILLGIAAIGAGIGLLGTSAFLIASAALHPSIADLQVAIVGVRFFGISRAAFRYLERLVSHSVNLRVLSHLRVWFYRQVESTTPVELFTQKSGDLLDRVMGNLEILENFYVRVVSPVIVAVVVGTGISMFIGSYATELGTILAAGLIINGLLVPAFSILVTQKISRKLSGLRASLSADTVEFIQGFEDLQSNGAHIRWMNALNQQGIEAGHLQIKISTLGGINSGLSLLILNFTVLGLLWCSIPMVANGSISGVTLAVIMMMGMASFETVGNLPQAAVMFNASIEATNKLFAIGQEKQIQHVGAEKSENWSPTKIRVEDLSFEYEKDHEFRLDHISLMLERGKKIALIGPSGSGKTSLVNLLLRFWVPEKGSIFFDQLDANELDPYQIRSCFAVISQSTRLFSLSLRDNLLMAAPHADDDRLLQAIKNVELDEWLKSLPQSLDTWLGDQGMRLSGGERQRVSIARAILQDRPFIILDEPTENLDPLMGKKILETVFRLFTNKGLLLITHDTAYLEEMDEVLYLDQGEIIERGDYQSLIKQNGKFAALMEIQSQILEK